jgi:sterol desaturase/sphingolipid hydroxylase (fatty acid hydroxylase superfamily)
MREDFRLISACAPLLIETTLGEIFHHLMHVAFSKTTLAVFILIAVRLVILTAIEKRAPAYNVPYREVLPRDVLVTLLFVFGVLPAADFLDRHIIYPPMLPQSILQWPLAIRLLFYFVLADLGHYWVHRMLHTRHLWRAHKWHHAPTYMYWQAGVRSSIVQQSLVNVPYILAGVFLGIQPWWLVWAITLKNIGVNDYQHLNVSWGNRWLEWFVVTPRYHHIHHSDNPIHYRSNLAAIFPIWDHLFGTYFDPEKAPKDLSFGIGETVPPVRLVIGL